MDYLLLDNYESTNRNIDMSKKDDLLKVAEVKVRQGGYNNFSFREIANEVGIKSASVHYHFPTKADLGAELAHQYTDAFLSALVMLTILKREVKTRLMFILKYSEVRC